MLKDISENLYNALKESCNACTADLISLSGGLDSSIIAYFLRSKKPSSVAIIAQDFVSTDLTYCQMISNHLDFTLFIHHVQTTEILEAIEQTIKILKNFNDIEIRNSIVMYMAIKWAKENGHDKIITGDGADELFAGYNFLQDKSEKELESEIKRICSNMHFPTQKIGKALNVHVESPYLDDRIVQIAQLIPANLKVKLEKEKKHGKWILRKTFEKYIPPQIAWREKSAMQDGSGTAGLTNLFNSIIDEEKFVEKKLCIQRDDDIRIRNRESMYYYEIYKKLYGLPVAGTQNTCPCCKYDVGDFKFCRMCGAFPI